MKLIALMTLFSTMVHANTITIKSNDLNEKMASIPQELAATFFYQGFKQTELEKNIFQIEVKNLECKLNSMNFYYPDDSRAGLPMVECFVGGKKIQEARYLTNLLSTIESQTKNFYIFDCAMGGRCILNLKSIKCISDLNQEEMFNAYSCELTSEE